MPNNVINKIKLPNAEVYDIQDANALHYIGKTSTALTDGATTNPITINGDNVTAVANNYVLANGNGNNNFYFNGTSWVLMDPASSSSGVTSVGVGNTSHLTVDPVAGTGNVTIDIDTGYSIPLTTSQTSWSQKSAGIKASNGTSTEVIADSTYYTTLVAGSNVSILGADTGADQGKITISATDTTYENKTAASGGTDVSLVTTGDKYKWDNKQSSIKVGSSAVADANHVTTFAEGANVDITAENGTITISATDTTYSTFDATHAGLAPAGGTTAGFLKNDGSWATPTNTTYEFAEGSTNGSFSVTPSGGSATPVAIHGLSNAAYKDVDLSIAASSTSTKLPTSQAVASFVEGKGYTTNTGTVTQIGATGGLKTNKINNADITDNGTLELNLKDTAYSTAVGNKETTTQIYPVVLDSVGHPCVGVPWTDTTYTQASNSAITVNNTDHTIDVAVGAVGTKGVVELSTSIPATGAVDTKVATEKAVADSISGKAIGANSSTTNAIATFAGTDGKTLANSAVTIAKDATGVTDDDTKVPTSKAVKTYVDATATGISRYIGTITATSQLSTTAKKGDFYIVSTAWTGVHVGDEIIAEKNGPAQTIDGTNWTLLHNEADTNTTYAFAEGTDNGKFTVTPSDTGTAQSVTVHGLKSAAYTESTAYATSSHVHGNITNAGALQTTDVSIATGDKLVVTDASDSNKVARTSAAFDGSTTTKCLTQKGTFETFGTSNLAVGTGATDAAAGNHTHGNVTNAGTITASGVTIASGDALAIVDSSDSSKIAKTSVTFDGSTTGKALTQKGTFESYQTPITASAKLSSDYVDDTNKTHKFATAAQLTQIATNQSNILSVKEYTRRNVLSITDRAFTAGTNNRSAACGIPPLSGKVVVYFGSLTSTDTDSSYCAVGFSDANGTTITTSSINRGNDVSVTLDLGDSVATSMFIYPGNSWSASAGDSLEYKNGMVIEKELYDHDPSYTGYSAPNYDLTRLESEDRAGLIDVVDSGAKNIVDLSATGSGTHNAVTFTNLGNNRYKVNGTPSAADTHLDIMGTWSTVPSFLSNNVGKTIVFATNHDHIYYGIIPIVGGSPLEYVGGNKSTPVAYTIPSNLSGALLRIYVDTNHTYDNVTAELLACTKAAFGVSSKFVPYRPNYDLVCNSVIDLNDMISSFIVNSSKPVTIKLRRDGSFAMLMFGFVQTIGQVHWYVQSPLTGDALSVIDAITGSAVSQSVITFNYNYSTATLTISAATSGNCNFVLIRSAY